MNWKAKIIEKLGGYPTIESALDAVQEKESAEKYQILTLAVKKLFNTVGAEDILRTDAGGNWIFQGKHMTDAMKKLLMAEANQFEETTLWKVLQADIKYQANRKMYLLAKTEMDIVAGKLWGLTLDAFRTRITSMRAGSALFNNQK